MTDRDLLDVLAHMDEQAAHNRKVQSENEDKGLNQTADIYRIMANTLESCANMLRRALSSPSSAIEQHVAAAPSAIATVRDDPCPKGGEHLWVPGQDGGNYTHSFGPHCRKCGGGQIISGTSITPPGGGDA